MELRTATWEKTWTTGSANTIRFAVTAVAAVAAAAAALALEEAVLEDAVSGGQPKRTNSVS